MIKVRFNDPDEFLHELRERPPDVEPVVRVTCSFEHAKSLPLQSVSVVAGYARRGDGGLPIVVELRRFVGQVFPPPGGDPHGVRAAADELVGRLTAEAQALGFGTPGGVYELEEERGGR